jgi:hypothetical protein
MSTCLRAPDIEITAVEKTGAALIYLVSVHKVTDLVDRHYLIKKNQRCFCGIGVQPRYRRFAALLYMFQLECF